MLQIRVKIFDDRATAPKAQVEFQAGQPAEAIKSALQQEFDLGKLFPSTEPQKRLQGAEALLEGDYIFTIFPRQGRQGAVPLSSLNAKLEARSSISDRCICPRKICKSLLLHIQKDTRSSRKLD